MSDYMFMLESHLTGEQFRVVGQMQEIANAAGVSLYLTGGALRDVLGGFPVRDLDFTVEANPSKLVKAAEKQGAVIAETDELKKSVHLRFPGGVISEIAMAHTERFPKPGGKPQIAPSTMYEDLRCRDFTVNAIGLSLNRASLGLMVDPTNGIGDIERKELRTTHQYAFYDDPSRMLRMHRFRVRLGYTIDDRTKLQYENAREAEMLTRISDEALGNELRRMAEETNVHDLVKALEEEKLLELFSPTLVGAKINYADLAKLQKARQMVPFGFEFKINSLPLFLEVLLDKLNAKERSAFLKATALSKGEIAKWQKLPADAKKLEKDLKNPKLQKPSHIYNVLAKAPGEQILYLDINSDLRIIHDRIRNYFQKYLPTALEVTNDMVAATGVVPGTPKFQKAKDEMTVARLDARPKKPAPEPEQPPPPPPMSGFARGPGVRHARG